jgi:hypothetical protein
MDIKDYTLWQQIIAWRITVLLLLRISETSKERK